MRTETLRSPSLYWFACFLALNSAALYAGAQTAPEKSWTWVSGSNLLNQTGVYGTKGTASAGNIPGGRFNANGWLDKSGNIWVFGGYGAFASSGIISQFRLNDMWQYSPVTGLWKWVAGTNLAQQPGIYGTQGAPADNNTPGARQGAASWTDSNGNLWLFGGDGYDAAGNWSNQDDLWKFNPATAQWTWIAGSSTQPTSCGGYCGHPGVYGSKGTAANGNLPGSRYYATTFTDKSGNLWLFGGIGDDSQGMPGWLNDLWEYSPSSGQWAWMAGDSTLGSSYHAQSGVYGTIGKPSATSNPGGRYGAAGWVDGNGNLWVFGGFGVDSTGAYAWLNDLWKFDTSSNQWTWISGSNSDALFGGWTSGVVGDWLTPTTASTPSGRYGAVSWTDTRGRLWMFGGDGIYEDSMGPGNNPYLWNLNDLWMFDPSTNQWTLMDGIVSLPMSPYGYFYTPPGIYGTQGVPSITNLPGIRSGAIGLADSSGRFWLFGGIGVDKGNGVDSNLDPGSLNDLWSYQSGTTAQSVVASPTFSPASGNLSVGQTVQISDSTPGASIYYMIDQNAPPVVYNQPITVNSSETIVAIAAASGIANSSPTLATYSVSATATPTFSLSPGEYSAGQTVSILDGTPGALIYYTLDGTTPTTASTLYQAPIIVASSETIEAVAVCPGYTISAVAAAKYTIWPAAAVNEWAWKSGKSTAALPIWGSKGVPSVSNNPGPRTLPAYWTDAIGNFWMFGGYGYDAHQNNALLNDLWEFTPSSNEWTWVGGDSIAPYGNGSGQSGVYGTQGTPAINNLPGGREGAASWSDGQGNFWLYGGNGYDSARVYGELSDLWLYKQASNQWTWISGSQNASNCFTYNGYKFCAGDSPVYGTLGQAAPMNNPGGRDGASTWVDSKGNLWLFGGHGVDPNIPGEYAFNDLWMYSPSTSEWTWVAGSNTDKMAVCVFDPNSSYQKYCGNVGTYGTPGTASAGNNPGGRSGASAWTDLNGNLWLFGGMGFDSVGNINPSNDLWEFLPSTSQWIWKGGGSSVLPCVADWNGTCTQFALPVVYGDEGVPSVGNLPGYAGNAASWTDASGNFWLYSGSYSSSSYTTGLTFGAFYGWNDLWEYSPSATEWTWMNGTKVTATSPPSIGPTVGTQGVPDPTNSPGNVFGVPTWTDRNGNLWMFNGIVWEFHPSAPTPVPTFALSLSSTSISAPPGSSGGSVLTTVVGGGFNSIVVLSASGQPSGVTVQFNPASINGAGQSQISLSIAANVAPGTYKITVTGVSGASTQTATLSLTVIPPPPTFQFTTSASSLSIKSGGSGTLTLTVTPQNGFNAAVSFACSGLPSGTLCSFAPNTVTPSGGPVSDVLTISANASAMLSYPQKGSFPLSTLAMAAAVILLRKRFSSRLFALVILAMSFSIMSACGGGSSAGGGGGGTKSTTSIVTVSATAGTVAQTATVTLTVN